ncbi:hypothetical protein [Gephyromycinifex aptenodytis]|uniref:hypothetical protein n=1 Tax=Gephyromycinifex aptenodytis TaxID=2716227 RepID=UPI0014485805|nr:hypothetical protein [Gephyromycinifex aptenodytis]
MTELTSTIRDRAREAIESLQAAEAEDDPHLADMRLGELESLAQTAVAHDLHLPELTPYLSAS